MIKKFSVTYVPIEDRLLLQLSLLDNADYSLWLTRSVVEKTLIALATKMEVPSVSRVNAVPTKSNLQVPSSQSKRAPHIMDDAAAAPPALAARSILGAQPVLVTSLHITLGAKVSEVKMGLVTNQTLTMQLNGDMLAQLANLLLKVSAQINWTFSSTPHTYLSIEDGDISKGAPRTVH